MPTLLPPKPTSFSIRKKSSAIGNDSVIETVHTSPQTKKTFSPSFTQSLLCLFLLVVLLGNFVRTTCDGLGRLIQTSSGRNVINYNYDPEVEFLELGYSINGSRTWNLYGPDRSGTYGGAQGIGGLEGAYQENTSFAYNTINNYFGDTVGIVAPTYNNPAPYPGVVGGYGPMPGSEVNHDLEPQWRGHYLDATGFYYMGARYYDPINGRFLSPDPLGHDVGLDLYSYCNGDPVNGLDPDGRCVESTLNAVPGQAAWQQSVSSFNNGDYGQATLSFGLMLSEQALTVATFGMGSVASAGGEMASSVATETIGGAEVFTESHSIVPYSGQITPNTWPSNAGFLGNVSKTELQVGTAIDRYGLRSGTYVAPQGTPFANRGLPSAIAQKFIPEAYEVIQPLKVNTGLSAPGFGFPGLGTQHALPMSVQELIDIGVLKPK